jgi:hypothetical protein
MLIGIGQEAIQRTAARVLSHICESYPAELSSYALLIEGLLYSYESLSLEVFKFVIGTLVAITLLTPTRVTQEATLCVFIRKMMASPKADARKVGVITAAAFLNRIAAFVETGDIAMAFFESQFTEDLQAIIADPVSTDLFFAELASKPGRGLEVNEFLTAYLRSEILGLRREVVEDDNLWFDSDGASDCIDFSASTNRGRVRATNQNQNVVYARGGLRLFLDSMRERDLDLVAEFGDTFALPLAMFDR